MCFFFLSSWFVFVCVCCFPGRAACRGAALSWLVCASAWLGSLLLLVAGGVCVRPFSFAPVLLFLCCWRWWCVIVSLLVLVAPFVQFALLSVVVRLVRAFVASGGFAC